MMSDTPETDEQATPIIGFYSGETVTASLARRLERERDQARRAYVVMRACWRSSISLLEGIVERNEKIQPGSATNIVVRAITKDLLLDYETAGAPGMRAVPVNTGTVVNEPDPGV